NPAAVADYRAGKAAAAQAIMGAVMKATGGRADPVRLRALVESALQGAARNEQ
ncbi:MAG: hypothetical protein AAGU77_07030, partial [Bacillota bacterium]